MHGLLIMHSEKTGAETGILFWYRTDRGVLFPTFSCKTAPLGALFCINSTPMHRGAFFKQTWLLREKNSHLKKGAICSNSTPGALFWYPFFWSPNYYTLPKVQSSQHRFFCWNGCLKIIGWFNIQGPDVKSTPLESNQNEIDFRQESNHIYSHSEWNCHSGSF